MAGPLDQLIQKLSNRDAGWVNRRDAAQALGTIAGQALHALKSLEKEPDQDVRSEIRKALGTARAGLEGVAPTPGAQKYSMTDFAREIASPPKRIVETDGDGLTVAVSLPNGNRQRISIQPHDGASGVKLIRVYTRCGKPLEGSYDWALRTNMETAQCALALTKENSEDMYWLVNHFLAHEAKPSEVKAAVKEISFYGDWIEQRMTGQDKY